MDKNSLAHTTWNCKYHIVFAPKYRRKIIFGELKQDIANILSMLCKRKEVNIVEAEICRDHVHMLVEIPPKISVSGFVRLAFRHYCLEIVSDKQIIIFIKKIIIEFVRYVCR